MLKLYKHNFCIHFLSAANVFSSELRFYFKQQKNLATAKANLEIWFGNLNDKTARLSMMTFAYLSTSYLVYAAAHPLVSSHILK